MESEKRIYYGRATATRRPPLTFRNSNIVVIVKTYVTRTSCKSSSHKNRKEIQNGHFFYFFFFVYFSIFLTVFFFFLTGHKLYPDFELVNFRGTEVKYFDEKWFKKKKLTYLLLEINFMIKIFYLIYFCRCWLINNLFFLWPCPQWVRLKMMVVYIREGKNREKEADLISKREWVGGYLKRRRDHRLCPAARSPRSFLIFFFLSSLFKPLQCLYNIYIYIQMFFLAQQWRPSVRVKGNTGSR